MEYQAKRGFQSSYPKDTVGNLLVFTGNLMDTFQELNMSMKLPAPRFLGATKTNTWPQIKPMQLFQEMYRVKIFQHYPEFVLDAKSMLGSKS